MGAVLQLSSPAPLSSAPTQAGKHLPLGYSERRRFVESERDRTEKTGDIDT